MTDDLVGRQTDAEVATIAAGLTVDERRALYSNVMVWGGRFAGFRSWQTVGRALLDKGLVRFVDDPRSSDTRRTQIGTRVAQHLKQENSHG